MQAYETFHALKAELCCQGLWPLVGWLFARPAQTKAHTIEEAEAWLDQEATVCMALTVCMPTPPSLFFDTVNRYFWKKVRYC